MNIFASYPDPVKCAQTLDDKRLGKMIMESNQLLSQAVLFYDPTLSNLCLEGQLCKITHKNVGVARWVRKSRCNFMWLLHHAIALSLEYVTAFGYTHASTARTDFIAGRGFASLIPDTVTTPMHNSARNAELGLDFTHLPVFKAYKHYLNARWKIDRNRPKWSNRPIPEFYNTL